MDERITEITKHVKTLVIVMSRIVAIVDDHDYSHERGPTLTSGGD